MDKKLRETTNLCVEIWTVNDKLWGNLVTWYKDPFAVWRKRDAYPLYYYIKLVSGQNRQENGR